MTDKTNETQEKVNSICNAYVAEFGKPPKSRYLLTQDVEFTSTSTAFKYFNNWKKEYDANQQALFDSLGFSDDFNNALLTEVSRFTTQSEQRYKQKADEAKELAESALTDLELIEERYHKQQAVVSTQESQIKQLEKELSEYQKAANVIEEELRQQLETQKDEFKKEIEHYKQAEKDANETSEKLRTELAKSELKMENNDKLAIEAKEQRNHVISENKQLLEKLAQANKHAAQLETKLEGKESLINELKTHTQRIETDNIAIKQKLVDLENNNIKTETELRTELKTTSDNLNSKEVKIAELLGHNKQLEDRFDALISKEKT